MLQKEYKSSLLKMIKFCIIFLIIDFSLGYIVKELFYSQKTGKYARATYTIDDTEADILVFGSSHAHRHYIPDILEKELKQTSYNAGAEGQQLLYHTALQEMVLKRYTPKTIILNIDDDFLYKFDEAYSRLGDLHPYYGEHKNELKDVLGLRSRFINFKLFFKSYTANSTIVHVIRYAAAPQIDYKGYRPLYGKLTPELAVSDNGDNREEVIDQNFIDALRTFITNAKMKNIELFFVTSPSYFEKVHKKNGSFDKIKEIAANETIPLINFYNAKEFISKNELFHDLSHLNKDGATIFMKLLSERIKEVRSKK